MTQKQKNLLKIFSKNFNSKLITISSKNSNNCDFFIELKNDMIVITDKKKIQYLDLKKITVF